ncbi:MAG TPA: PAS domain S-box protein [Candidatus Obscuribacterales bacterium]
MIIPEDLPGVLACFDRHVQSHGEEPFYNEVRYRHKDGSTVWVMCSGRVIEWDASGKPLRMVGCHVDISERKHLELELQESKATLQDILENAPAAIVTLRQLADRFWVTTYRSSGCDRVFGYTVKELKDTPGLWLSRVVEEDRHYAITNDTSLDSLPYHCTAEYRFRHKDGGIRWISAVQSIRWDETLQCAIATLIESDITQSKRAELALQDSEVRYRTLLETSPVGIFRNDVTGQCIYANPQLQDMTGLPLEDILGDGWNRNLHPENKDFMAAAWSTFVEQSNLGQEASYQHEYRYFAADGSERWGFVQAVPEYSASGLLVGFVGSTVDITDRKLAEEQVRASEAALLEAQQVAHIGNWMFDPATQTITWSQELYRMFGLDPSQPVPIYADYLQKIHPDDRPTLIRCVEQAIAHGIPYTFDYRAIQPDGSLRYHEGRGKVEKDAQGQVTRLFGTALDITKRKLIEAALQASESRFRAIFEQAAVGINQADRTGRLVEANQYFCTLLGYSRDELLALTVQDITHPDDRVVYGYPIPSIFERDIDAFTIEKRYRHKDGTWIWAEVTMSVIRDAYGQPCRDLAIVIDIRDRKRLEQELKASQAQLSSILNSAEASISSFRYYDNQTWETIYHSPACTVIFGYPLDDFPAEKWLSSILPDDAARVMPQLLQAIYDEQTTTVEYRYHRPDGRICWIADTISSRREESISGWEVTLVGIDISDRKQAEVALEREVLRRRTLFEASIDGIVILDQAGNILESNASFARMLGYSVDEMTTLSIMDFEARWSPEELEAKAETMEFCGDTFETLHRRQDGSIYPVEISSSSVDWYGELVNFCVCRDISDRKQMEAELVHSRDFRELIFNESSDALFLVDPDTLLTTDCNQRAVELFEASCQEDLIQMEGHRLQKRPFTESEIVSIRQEVEQQGFWSLELEYITFQGREFWGDLSAKNITFGDQHFQLVRIADITDRKQAELALQRLHEELQTFLDYAPALISLFDHEGRYVRVNPAFAQTLGRSQSDIVGHTFEELFPDAIAMVFRERLQRLIISRSPLMVEDDVELEGEIRTFQSILFPVATSGETNNYWAIATDITERKQMEQALQVQEQQFRGIFNSAVRFIGLLSPDGKFLDVNHTALQLCTETRQDLMGITIWDSPWVTSYPETQAIMQEGVERASQGETSQAEIVVMGIDQIERYVDVTFKPLLDPEGQVYQILAEGSDISDRKRAEMHVQEARIAAETANQAKSRFLANMSHELRTPLNAVLGYAQILMRDPDLAYQYQDYIQTIFSSGHHLLSLINDVLDLAKVESGHMGIDLEVVNLPFLLNSIYGLLRQEIRTRGLALEIEADPRLPQSIITDGKRLKQVLINLLGNAIKFTPRGTITLRVIVGAVSSPSNVPMVALTFQVEDPGIGISPEDQQRIFEAFEQADAGRQLSGSTGLGLAISQQLVTLLGGHLQLCSEVGQGSTFQFTLVVELAGNTSDGLTLPPTITGLATGQPPCRILVVDDQAVNRQFLEDALGYLGFEVYLAKNGQEAIAAWQTYQLDLILMDQRLPDFHGEQVTANIREWEVQNQRSATPIFMVSASSMDSDRSGAIAAGCNAFLEKPIQIPDLLQAIAQYLDVEFTSEEAIALPDTTAATLTPADLKVMPLDWIAQLYEAATQCRNDRIDHLIAEIPDDYAVLKQTLSDYNYNIQVDVIMDLSFACLETET